MTTTQKTAKAANQNVVATLQGVEVLEGLHLLPVIFIRSKLVTMKNLRLSLV